MFKPNEQVIKIGFGDIVLDCGDKIHARVIVTNQNRIYLNSKLMIIELDDIKDITYFNRNFFNKDGVHVITKNKEAKFLVKKRKEWEKLFSKLY